MVDVIIKHGERVVDENGKESWTITLDSKTINKGDDTDKSKLVIESWSGVRQEDVPEESVLYPTITLTPDGEITYHETQPRTRDWTPSFGKNVPVILVTTPSTIDDAMLAIIKKKVDAALIVTRYKDSLDAGCSNIPIGFKITDMHGDAGVIVDTGDDKPPYATLRDDKHAETLARFNELIDDKLLDGLSKPWIITPVYTPVTLDIDEILSDPVRLDKAKQWLHDLDINSMYWQGMQAHEIMRKRRVQLHRLKIMRRTRRVIYRTYMRRGFRNTIYQHVPWPILKTYPL